MFKRILLNVLVVPGAPLTYFTDRGGSERYFGSEILAKWDYLGL